MGFVRHDREDEHGLATLGLNERSGNLPLREPLVIEVEDQPVPFLE